MAQYVIHKIGFFYTDENFEVGVEKGPVMGITRSLDEALAIKKREDIISLKKTEGIEPTDFFFDKPNYTDINKKLEAYIKSEFGTYIPKNITDEQAAKLLSIMEISFHNIVEYPDDVVINPAEFKFNIEDEVSGF